MRQETHPYLVFDADDIRSPVHIDIGPGQTNFFVGGDAAMQSYLETEVSNWRKMIAAEMKSHGETFDDVVAMCAETGLYHEGEEGQLGEDDQFSDERWLDIDFRTPDGNPYVGNFTVWTEKRAYYPNERCEIVESVARHPDNKAIDT